VHERGRGRARAHAGAFSHTHRQTHTYMHKHTNTRTHATQSTRKHTCTRTLAHTHTHTYTHKAHTHTHTTYPRVSNHDLDRLYAAWLCVLKRVWRGGIQSWSVEIHTCRRGCVHLCVWRMHLCVFLAGGSRIKKVISRGL